MILRDRFDDMQIISYTISSDIMCTKKKVRWYHIKLYDIIYDIEYDIDFSYHMIFINLEIAW
jgi:hypothetical protein